MHFFHTTSSKRLIFQMIFILLILSTAGNAFSISRFSPKRTIVIDPGHGGFDTGTKGADSTLEKTISLVFAKKIKGLLDKKFNVVLTRTDDYWVDTRQRAEIANSAKADLFISIHANGSFIRETKGSALIYYTPHAANKKTAGEPLQATWHQTQTKYIPLSRLLAKAVFKRVANNPAHNSPRIDRLPVSLLAGANMPALLLEIGHLTNPLEEKQLNNPDFLADFAKEVSTEIDSFLEEHPTIH